MVSMLRMAVTVRGAKGAAHFTSHRSGRPFDSAVAGAGVAGYVKRTFRSVIRPTNDSEMGHHHPRSGSPPIAQAFH
jgi:hypothetical protein